MANAFLPILNFKAVFPTCLQATEQQLKTAECTWTAQMDWEDILHQIRQVGVDSCVA